MFTCINMKKSHCRIDVYFVTYYYTVHFTTVVAVKYDLLTHIVLTMTLNYKININTRSIIIF